MNESGPRKASRPVAVVHTKWGPWNGRMLRKLKDGYKAARRDSKMNFILDGQPVLTEFAKHLIEYLEMMGLEEA